MSAISKVLEKIYRYLEQHFLLSSTNQLLALTTHIENGSQKIKKISVYSISPNSVIFYRPVFPDQNGRIKRLNNGLPQDSVMAPLLFSLYIADFPETTTKILYMPATVNWYTTLRFWRSSSYPYEGYSKIGTLFLEVRLQSNTSKTLLFSSE